MAVHAPSGPTLGIVHVAPPRMRSGNRVTALRWAGVLRELGCRVFVERSWSGRACDALIALHAGKTLDSIRRFRAARPHAALIVGCAGTDVYGEHGPTRDALEGLAHASHLVVFQPRAIEALPPAARPRARVIYQSVRVPPGLPRPDPERFDLALVANLRAVKDPLLAARSLRLLPAHSRAHVFHAGAILDPELGARAQRESATNPRYTLLGALDHRATLARIARSSLLLLPSWNEGGSNVLSEAIALGVPSLCSRIPGSSGILGETYEGFFPAGDAGALAQLLERAERDAPFLARLAQQTAARAFVTRREHELAAWRSLLTEAL